MMQFTNLADFLQLSDSLTAEAKKKDKNAAFIAKRGIKSKWKNAIDEAIQVQPMTMEERAEVFAPKIKVSSSKQAKFSIADDKNKNNKRKYSTDQDGTKRAKQDNVKSEVSKLRKSEISKSKNSRTVKGSSNDNTSTKIDKSEKDDGVFEVYYERNRDFLVDEYPNATEKDIEKYLRKTWDSMDPAFRKKYRLYKTRDRSYSKESTPDEEDLETSVETDTSPKEKRTKVDKEESSISEIKRDRPYNLFKDSLTAEAKKKDKNAAFIVKRGIKSKRENAIDEAIQVQPLTMEERAEVFAPKIKVSSSKQAKSSTADDKNKNNKRKYSTDQDGTKRAKQDNVKSEVSKLRKSEISKSKNSRTVKGKFGLKLISDFFPSSSLSHKSSNDYTSTKIDKSEKDDGVFEVYYERNRDFVVDEYPNATEKDIEKYLRKIWDSMDPAFRKKYRLYKTRDRSYSKESTPDEEDLETSVGTDTSPKESKKRTKIDKEESSISETKL